MIGPDIPLEDLDVVGFADTLEKDLLPRLVSAVFRRRSVSDEFVLPPLVVQSGRVVACTLATAADFERAVAHGQATRIAPIPAKADYQLWIDRDFSPRYQPTDQVGAYLRSIARDEARKAKEAIRAGKYDQASRSAQVAISADERSLDALLVKAIVLRRAGAEDEVAVLCQLAEIIAPDVDFKSWVDLYFAEASPCKQSVDVVRLVGPEKAQDSGSISLRLVFKDAGAIDPAKLGDFLCLFRGVYAAALTALVRSSSVTKESIDRKVRAHLRRLDPRGIDSLFSMDLGTDALMAHSLSYHSPIEMIVSGKRQALLVAIRMAGGHGEVASNVDASLTMPDIPTATKQLRLSLVPALKTPVGYGVRPKYVKLSGDELRELLHHDPLSERRGGFQRFIIGLQYRVNRETGELPLWEHEIEFILRHGQQARKGGWQSSIRKMFERHFDFQRGTPVEDRQPPAAPVRKRSRATDSRIGERR